MATLHTVGVVHKKTGHNSVALRESRHEIALAGNALMLSRFVLESPHGAIFTRRRPAKTEPPSRALDLYRVPSGVVAVDSFVAALNGIAHV